MALAELDQAICKARKNVRRVRRALLAERRKPAPPRDPYKGMTRRERKAAKHGTPPKRYPWESEGLDNVYMLAGILGNNRRHLREVRNTRAQYIRASA